jgi:ribonuclease E
VTVDAEIETAAVHESIAALVAETEHAAERAPAARAPADGESGQEADAPASTEPAILLERDAIATRSPAAPIDLGETLKESGLVMIETSQEKIATIGSELVTAPSQPLGRRPKPTPIIPNEPLEQVETHK